MKSKKSEAELVAWGTRRRFLSGMLRMIFLPDALVCMQRAGIASLDNASRNEKEHAAWLYHLSRFQTDVEIEDVLTRYCYAVDDREWDLYRGLFTPDAVIDDRVTGGIQSGVEEHIEYLSRALSKVVLSQHAISTVRIDLGVNTRGCAPIAPVQWWWIWEKRKHTCSSRDCGIATHSCALPTVGRSPI